MNMNTYTFALIAGLVYIVFTTLVLKITGNKKKVSRKNLINDRGASSISMSSSGGNEKQNQAKTKEKSRLNISKKLKQAAQAGNKEGLSPSSVRYLLIQAGLETPVYKFWIYSLVSGALFFFLAKFFNLNQIVIFMLTFTGLFGFPRFILKRKVKKRQKKFLEEMPDCLEAMVRLLKSGMPISEAIAMTSREYTGPIGEEVTKVYEAQRVGDTLPEAVQSMAFRVPISEVKMFATAITIQVQTGSSLSEVLQNLSNVIRQRFRLKRKVQSLSAEAKISASIIGALPVLVMGGMALLRTCFVVNGTRAQTVIHVCRLDGRRLFSYA